MQARELTQEELAVFKEAMQAVRDGDLDALKKMKKEQKFSLAILDAQDEDGNDLHLVAEQLNNEEIADFLEMAKKDVVSVQAGLLLYDMVKNGHQDAVKRVVDCLREECSKYLDLRGILTTVLDAIPKNDPLRMQAQTKAAVEVLEAELTRAQRDAMPIRDAMRDRFEQVRAAVAPTHVRR